MPKHEFGIMREKPAIGKRYDEYEPNKYSCISVDDSFIEEILEPLSLIDFYWHTLDVTGKGLAYCGITLIPPDSLSRVIDVLGEKNELSELQRMLSRALAEDNYVIHFGI